MCEFSVVLPVYNRKSRVKRAISSVFSQQYSDFELIVVDDGSEQNIESVVDGFSSNKVRYTRLSHNKGANAARNKGIQQSNGEYISFLDSDDKYTSDRLQRISNFINNMQEDVVGVYTGFKNRYPEKQETISVPAGRYSLTKYRHQNDINPIGGFSSVVLSKSAIVDVGGLDESLQSAQDIDLYLRILHQGTLFGISEVLAIRYTKQSSAKDLIDTKGGDQISSNPGKKIDGLTKFLEKHSHTLNADIQGDIYYSLAWWYLSKGDVEKSRESFMKSFKLQSRNFSHIYYMLFSRFGEKGTRKGLHLEKKLSRYLCRLK